MLKAIFWRLKNGTLSLILTTQRGSQRIKTIIVTRYRSLDG